MQWLGHAADVVGILGAIFSLFAWLQARNLRQELDKERARQNKKVMVVLQNGGERLELPMELRRAELTRSEVLGRIGMIPMKEKGRRFSVEYVNQTDFLRKIDIIARSSDDDILTIPCTAEELAQFDVPIGARAR